MRNSIASMEVYNTLGRRTESLDPRDPGRVGIYLCGPTVQAAPHVGHGRGPVVFDVLRRFLEWSGYDVTFVSNVTDVNDSIFEQADMTGGRLDRGGRKIECSVLRGLSAPWGSGSRRSPSG